MVENEEEGNQTPPSFSSEEVEICIKVLKGVATDFASLESSSMRQFRKALAPVVEYMESRKFGGKTRKVYLEDKQLRREKELRHVRRKTHDKKRVNMVNLRLGRFEKMQELMQQGGEDLPLIADGTVNDMEMKPTKMICPEVSVEQKEETKTDEGLHKPRSCYTCKVRFNLLHEFYDQLCPDCASLNYTKRFQTSNLNGRTALVTGARVKIGFQTTIKLLLAGASVIATTRFPQDAAERFINHPKYSEFKDRLHIYGIDFRDVIHLEQFLQFVLSQYSRLDIIIHNACQTIRRPPTYYNHLIEKEMSKKITSAEHKMLTYQDNLEETCKRLEKETPTINSISSSAMKSQIPLLMDDENSAQADFPVGLLDVNGQQLDLRRKNSWLLRLGEISTPEVSEVFTINALAPFTINNKLLPLMEKTPSSRKFIINVSAMEGKFYRFKGPTHPHTNMAKAALNMMTRTCAGDLKKKGIFMNSVDTGWINDENPLHKAHEYAKKVNFQTPIDEIDAAARIVDPIFTGINLETDEPESGKFLKDYKETEW